MKNIENKNDWYKYCRICLEWLHPKRGLEPEKWIIEVVERAQRLNIDALAFDFYHGEGAVFNGSIGNKDRHIGDADLLELLDRELHKRGMRLVIMNMGGHCARYANEQYPQWRMKNLSGDDISWGSELFPFMCVNTPYSNMLLQEISEILSKYRVDGIYIEGLYGLPCFCDYCRTEFKNTYGYDLPVSGDNADVRQYRAGVMTDFIRRIRRVIDEYSPDTVFMPSPTGLGLYTDFEAWGEYAEVVSLERQWGYSRSAPGELLFDIGLSMRVMRALSGRQPFGTTFLAWTVDANYSHCTPEHYRLNFGEILVNGGTPQLHAQTIFDVDQSEMGVVREMYDFVEKLRPYLKDAHMLRYTALVVDWADFKPGDNFRGFAKALTEKHVPYDVISRKDLTAERLKKYKALLLPNLTRMSDEEIGAVLAFHASGGGIVMTFRTGCLCPDGSRRADNPLNAIAGIKGIYGVVSNPVEGDPLKKINIAHTYYKVIRDHEIGKGTVGRLQSITGSYAEIDLAGGVLVAQALDYDYSKMHRHHPVTGFYPGRPTDPLIVVSEQDEKGRVVYFAAEFDKASFTDGLPGTIDALAQATVWAAATPPAVEIEVSPTIEVTVHYDPELKAYTIMMLNQTTGDIRPGIVIRHVEPIYNIRINLRDIQGGIKKITSITGGKLEWKTEGDICFIELLKINEYEALTIELLEYSKPT